MAFNCRKKCYFKCTNHGPLHCFPKPKSHQKKFDMWKKILATDVIERGDIYIYNQIRLCNKHFEEYYISNSNRLGANAIPTLCLYDSSQTKPVCPTTEEMIASETSPSPVVMTSKSSDETITNTQNNNKNNQQQISDQDVLEDDIADAIEINLENNEAQHDDVEFVDELRLEKDPETLKHSDFKCNVCRGEIVGFRYVCMQCVDWDMCASCEARGEHPEHYVLRLPAPKPYAECGPVIAAIREQIAHLLLLRTEIKSEACFEAETNIDDIEEFDPNLTDPFSATTDRNVPKLNIISKKQSDIIAEIEIEANISDHNTQLMTDKTQIAPKLILLKSRLTPEVDRNVPELNLSMKPSETVTNIQQTVPVTDKSQTTKFILTKSALAPGVDRNVPKFNVISKKQSDIFADIEANIPNLNTDPVTVRPQTPKLILTKSSGLAPRVRIILDKSTSGGPAKRVYIVNTIQKTKKVKESYRDQDSPRRL